VSPGVVLKTFRQLAPHPWITGKLLRLQLAKWLFPLINPRPSAGRAGRIHQVSVRITDICNLRCHTCGQWGDHGFLNGADLKKLKATEVSPGRYNELFQDLVNHGHRPNVYLWGGEPMLYQGLMDVVRGSANLGLPAAIASNGHLATQFAPDLVKAPLYLMQLSIDGHEAGLHNRLRPSAGEGDAFQEIEAGLEELRRARRDSGRGLPVIVSLTVISKENARHLTDIYRTFRDRVDLFVFYLSWWIDPESARAQDADFQRRFGFAPKLHWGWLGDWRPDDYQALASELKEIKALSKPWPAPPVTFIPSLTAAPDLETYYTDHRSRFGFNQCVSIFQAVELDSNGDMSPCRDYHDYVVGNVKEHTITQLWNSDRYENFRRSLSTQGLMPVCSRCCGLMGY